MAPIAEAGILAALLLQFPWSFRCSPENQEYLEKLFRLLREFPLAVEVRHGGWDREPFYQFLKENRVAFCNVDQPVIGNSIRPGSQVTSRVGYFRLHGRNYKSWFNEEAGRDARYDYLYPKPEVQQIVGLLRTIQQNAEETYAITNNHFRGQSLTTALDILEEASRRPSTAGGHVPSPGALRPRMCAWSFFATSWLIGHNLHRQDAKTRRIRLLVVFLPSVLDSGQPDILKAKVSLAAHPKPPSEWFPWSAVLFRRAP